MRKIWMPVLVLAMVFTMAACGCDHDWKAADCVNPKTCKLCQDTVGTPAGHAWAAATCVAPRTCVICNLTEGAALDHSWVEASCAMPKHCETCDLKEGDALEHVWLDVTTEAPKTCENCGKTEGERIITDPRFHTAATRDLYGEWIMEMKLTAELLDLPGFPDGSTIDLIVTFGNEGTMKVAVGTTGSFLAAIKQYRVDKIYAEYADKGVDRAAVDTTFLEKHQMSVQDYVDAEIEKVDFDQLYESIFESAKIGGVYYVENGLLYTGSDWDADLTGETYTVDGDTLVVDSLSEVLGIEGSFTRVTEVQETES